MRGRKNLGTTESNPYVRTAKMKGWYFKGGDGTEYIATIAIVNDIHTVRINFDA